MSVIQDFQVSGNNPSNVGGRGIATFYFPRLSSSLVGAALSSTPNASNATGQLAVPKELNGRIFRVKVAGNILPALGGGSTWNLQLFANTGTVASPSYTPIASTGNVSVFSANRQQWAFDVTLQGDSVSGQVGGVYSAFGINGTVLKSSVAIDNQLTGIIFSNNVNGYQAAFGLVVGVTFATSNPANAASLYQFQIID
jgi:hypothetical protein